MELVLTGVVIAVVILYIKMGNLKSSATGDLSSVQHQKEIEKIRGEILDFKISISSLNGKINEIIEEKKIESTMIIKERIENPSSISTTYDKTDVDVLSLPFVNPSNRIKKWLLIKIGMDMKTVKDILGNPDRISEIQGKPYWQYEDGTFIFNNKAMGIDKYDYSFTYPSGDLSRWDEIKKGMSKIEVSRILGNPNSVTVESNYDDSRENWSYFTDEHGAFIDFDNLGRAYRLDMRTHQQIDQDGEEVKKSLGLKG